MVIVAMSEMSCGILLLVAAVDYDLIETRPFRGCSPLRTNITSFIARAA